MCRTLLVVLIMFLPAPTRAAELPDNNQPPPPQQAVEKQQTKTEPKEVEQAWIENPYRPASPTILDWTFVDELRSHRDKQEGMLDRLQAKVDARIQEVTARVRAFFRTLLWIVAAFVAGFVAALYFQWKTSQRLAVIEAMLRRW